MTNPIVPNGVQDVSVHEFQAVVSPQRVPGGLTDVQTTLEQRNVLGTPCQILFSFFHIIYAGLCFVINALIKILCGCCIDERKIGDDICCGLASFNNSGISGQINGIYITTNETNLAAVRELFNEQPRPSEETRTIHIGCATWHNLDIMCARKSTYGLIIDFNPKNAEFVRKTMDLIASCESREAFKVGMMHYLNSLTGGERDLFFHADQQGLPTDRLERELSREGSWLQSDENYLYVKRELVSKGRLIPITEDIKNFENISRIRHFLDENHIVIDTLYMSNISNFMTTPNDRNAFVRSIKLLLNRDSILIHCPRIRQGNSEITLRQKAILGREILEDSYNSLQLFEEVQSF